MRLMVGCPVKDRDWIMNQWFDHVYNALDDSWEVEFVFVLPDKDLSLDIIEKRAPGASVLRTFESNDPYVRDWSNKDRYVDMVHLRNMVLQKVRHIHPDFFLSLDSDILIEKNAIRSMIGTISNIGCNAVSSPTFLDPVDARVTNAALMGARGNAARLGLGNDSIADVIMAIKLMDLGAFNIDYGYDKRGEDFGWSKNVLSAGLKLGFAGGAKPSKHVMGKEWMDRIDKRCGY